MTHIAYPALVLSMGLAACMPGHAKTTAPVACALRADAQGAMTLWQAEVQTATPLTGTYELVLSTTTADIAQDGPFAAAPGDRLVLGEVLLPSAPAPEEARLTLNVAGQTLSCATVN